MTGKQKQSKYLVMLKAKKQEQWDRCGYLHCDNCLTNCFPEGSHRLPRTYCIGEHEQLYYNPTNIDLLCRTCHDKMHTSRMRELTICGGVLKYLENNHREFYQKTVNKFT